MVKQEDKMTGCILGKIRPEIQTARANACKENECAQCGFNFRERDRRRQLLRRGGLEEGPDGLKRLYLGPKILREPSDDKEAET